MTLDLRSILSGRVGAISRRVVVTSATRRGRKAGGRCAPPGYRALSAKLARASEQVRRARHGRPTA
jgi:hypothetical protein